ncbi:MAG: hypothetical protein M3483_00780 [Gemmatimonadota bacterium]|nr:hypothetical protein [Gemmatimonadota bacterium]
MDSFTPRSARIRERSDEGRGAGGVARWGCAGTVLGDGRGTRSEIRLHDRRREKRWHGRQRERRRQTVQVQALAVERGGMIRLVIQSGLLDRGGVVVGLRTPLVRVALGVGGVRGGME